MASRPAARRLAAILNADVVGYGRLVARDEVGTLETLKSRLDLMGGLIRQHGGRVVDAVGDNLLAEFPSAVDGVACAAEIQRRLAARNAELPAERRMHFRIGLDLGDLVVEDERIVGAGVNVAARIQALAEPGGVCVSHTIFEQVDGKLPLHFEDRGEQRLKNVPRPVRVFRAVLTGTGGSGGRGAPAERESATSASPDDLTVPGFGGQHAIAVMPFENLSRDADQEYFADGIAEDLVTRLSASRAIPVIARNSSFAFKGKSVDAKTVSRELGVRYLVEGSVRKAGNRVRVSAQLVDATSGRELWAERYDRELAAIFSVQDELTEKIGASVVPALSKAEIRRALRRPPRDLDTWDLLQRALWHLSRYTPEDIARAQAWLRQAIERQPDSPTAFSLFAFTHIFEIIYRWSEHPDRARADALGAAEKAVALDPDDPTALVALGFSCALTGRYERAGSVLESAIELNPSSALAYWALGAALTPAGCPECAIPVLQKAIRLSPQDPWMHEILFNVASAHFVAGRYEDAIRYANRSLQRRPGQPGAYRLLASAHGHLGRREEARAALHALERLMPDFAAAHLRAFLPPALVERYLEGLRKAGWEEDAG